LGEPMTRDVEQILDELLLLPAETEWVEFKEAKSGFEVDKLGRYFKTSPNRPPTG